MKRQNTTLKPSNISRRGFTIVELLIVIVVIAILAAITIVAYNGIQQRAKTSVVNDAASNWAKILQMQITQGAQISLSAACLGQAATDFPAGDNFLAGECVQVLQNGTKIASVVYSSSTFAGWKGTDVPPNGLLPTTSVTGTSSGNTYTYRARGAWMSTVPPNGGVAWIPVVAGQCGPGRSVAAESLFTLGSDPFGGDICGYSV